MNSDFEGTAWCTDLQISKISSLNNGRPLPEQSFLVIGFQMGVPF